MHKSQLKEIYFLGAIERCKVFELEAKVRCVYRSDSTVSRELFTGSATERALETSGKAIGDGELGWRYQLNDGGIEKPITSPASASSRAPGAIPSRS